MNQTNDDASLRNVENFLVKNLINAPPEIKIGFPAVLKHRDVSVFIFSTKKYAIISFLSPIEKQRISDLKQRNIHPYFALILPPNAKGNAFFKVDKSRNLYFGKMSLENGFAFAIGKDCTLILEQLRQSISIENKRYQYDIDLAYVISFGDEIKKENLLDYVKDTVSYSFEIWRK